MEMYGNVKKPRFSAFLHVPTLENSHGYTMAPEIARYGLITVPRYSLCTAGSSSLTFPYSPHGDFRPNTGRLLTYFLRCSNHREVSSRPEELTPPDRVTSIPVEKIPTFPI